MKNVLKLAMIGSVLAVGISAAAAQEGNTGRASYDDPVRYWNNDLNANPGADNGNGFASQTSGYNSGAESQGFYTQTAPTYRQRLIGVE